MAQRTKVLILLPVFDLGGAEKQGVHIAKSLQESGLYDVEVWALITGSGMLTEQLNAFNLKHKILNIPFSSFQNRIARLKVYFKFILELRKSKFDIIIPYTYHCNVLSASTFRFSRVQKCLWLQNAMEDTIPLSAFEKIALKFKPIYAANSKAAAEFISNKHSFSKDKVKFIPNAFEKTESKNDIQTWRVKLGASLEDIVLVMPANFFPEKDQDTLIKGLEILLKKHRNLILVFAGGPINCAKANQLKALAFDLKLQDNVKFIGSTNDISGLLKAADVGILSTRSEGCPNSLIEFMGYGLPIVASNILPITELLGEEYPYLFKVEDINDFVKKTDLLLQKMSNIQDLIDKNKKTVSEIYSVDAKYTAFHKLIQN